jgi:hypothetical protein
MSDNEQSDAPFPLLMSLSEFVRMTHHATTIVVQVQNDLHGNPDRVALANEAGMAAIKALIPDEWQSSQPRSVTIAATASLVASIASNLVGYEVTTGEAKHGSLESMIAAIALAAHQLVQSNTHAAMQLNELVGANDANN